MVVLVIFIIHSATVVGSQPQRTLFNGIVLSRIEFSEEEYEIGDIVDVTIHFELITEKNTENLNLAITDYSKYIFYTLRKNHLKLIKSQDIEFEKNYLQWDKRFLSLIESDEDLILSNLNPKGTYNIRFLINESSQIGFLQHSSQWWNTNLYIFLYNELTEYDNITDYQAEAYDFPFSIPLNEKILQNKYTLQEANEVYRGKYIRENNKNESNVSEEDKKKIDDDIYVIIINYYISDLYQIAVTAHNNDDYKRAEELYKSFISKYPNNALAVKSSSNLYWIVGKINETDESFINLQKYYYNLIDQYPNTRLAEECEKFANDCNKAIGDVLPALYWYEDRIYNSKSFTDSMYALIDLKSMYRYIGKKMPRELVNPKFDYDINKWSQESSTLIEILMEHSIQELEKDNKKYKNVVRLYANKPEPFDNETFIKLRLSKKFHIKLVIYDSENNMIKTLLNEELIKGEFTVKWDGTDENNKDVSSGKYQYELTVNGTKKERIGCTLLK